MTFLDEDHLRLHLLGLEKQLMEPAFRKDRARVIAVLAEEFREFGSSGRVWNKSEILDLLATESGWSPPQIEEFLCNAISSEIALVTYRTQRLPTEDGRLPLTTLRSSLWVKSDEQWKMIFHQGTIIHAP